MLVRSQRWPWCATWAQRSLFCVLLTLVLSGCGDDDPENVGDTSGSSDVGSDSNDVGGDDDQGRDTDVDQADTGVDAGDLGGDSGSDVETDVAAPDPSVIRLVHASPDAGPVDIHIAELDLTLFTNVEYGQVTAWFESPTPSAPLTVTLQIWPAGDDQSQEDNLIYQGELTLPPGGLTITGLLAGSRLSDQEEEVVRFLGFEHLFGDAVEGYASVRILDAAFDVGAIGIDLDDNAETGAELDAEVALFDSGVPSGWAIEADAAPQFGVWSSGEAPARVTSFTLSGLSDRGRYFAIAAGTLDTLARQPESLEFLLVNEVFEPDDSNPDSDGSDVETVRVIRQDPRVYALHLSPDAGAVDVFDGTTELFGPLNFGDLSTPIQVPPGTYNLDFFVANGDSTDRPGGDPLGAGSIELDEAQAYLAMAVGRLAAASGAEDEFLIWALRERFAVGDIFNARITLVHASPDVGPIDVGQVDGEGTNLRSDAIYYNAVEYLESSDSGSGRVVPPSTPAIFAVAPDTGSDDGVALASYSWNPTEGARVFLIAAGMLTPEGGESAFEMIWLDTSVAPWNASMLNAN